MKYSSPSAWFEIVTQDLERAIKFYESAFDIKLERMNVPDMQMALFPYDEAKGFTGGALVCSECYADHQAGPGTTIIYLNTDSVSTQLQKIIALGVRLFFLRRVLVKMVILPALKIVKATLLVYGQ